MLPNRTQVVDSQNGTKIAKAIFVEIYAKFSGRHPAEVKISRFKLRHYRLVGLLDLDLKARYGAQQSWYDQFNAVHSIDTVVVARIHDRAAGCGWFKPFDKDTVEIKRMFVKAEHPGKGIASRILAELETWAASLGFSKAILETGVKQPEAIHLYKKNGYTQINNFGQYAGVETSVCFTRKFNSGDAPERGTGAVRYG